MTPLDRLLLNGIDLSTQDRANATGCCTCRV